VAISSSYCAVSQLKLQLAKYPNPQVKMGIFFFWGTQPNRPRRCLSESRLRGLIRLSPPCHDGEYGVVISRYHKIDGYDWIAIPLAGYLSAVDAVAEIPTLVDKEQVEAQRLSPSASA
jgi:hypothetical protein